MSHQVAPLVLLTAVVSTQVMERRLDRNPGKQQPSLINVLCLRTTQCHRWTRTKPVMSINLLKCVYTEGTTPHKVLTPPPLPRACRPHSAKDCTTAVETTLASTVTDRSHELGLIATRHTAAAAACMHKRCWQHCITVASEGRLYCAVQGSGHGASILCLPITPSPPVVPPSNDVLVWRSPVTG